VLNASKAVYECFWLFSEMSIGEAATEAAIVQKLPQARIIHLATHTLPEGFKGNGVPGAIVLAPSSNDDGLLTASEIMNLKLNAELVVLSGDSTALGRITGDGVIGLSRSFMTAGVPNVIGSLWCVPDKPTAVLMTQFYRQLQLTGNPARALQLDRLQVRLWRGRWLAMADQLAEVEAQGSSDRELMALITTLLSDRSRPGTSNYFSTEQVVQIVA
jgi:CHAT domain-containing protein